MRLDPRRPYGTVVGWPLPEPGARFEQDGRYFRQDGSLIGEEPPPAEKRGPGRPRKDAMAVIYGEADE